MMKFGTPVLLLFLIFVQSGCVTTQIHPADLGRLNYYGSSKKIKVRTPHGGSTTVNLGHELFITLKTGGTYRFKPPYSIRETPNGNSIIVESKGSSPVEIYIWDISSAVAKNDLATNKRKAIAMAPIYILALPAYLFKMMIDDAGRRIRIWLGH